jgi:KaiC/GvpD/RAD55 family RecA-like ATPase
VGIALCLGARVTIRDDERQRQRKLVPVEIEAAEVVDVPRKWLWRNYLQFGKFTILEGPPGVGKTTFALDVLARYSNAWPMPDSDEPEASAVPPRKIIYVGSEDGDAEIKNRFLAARGDETRLKFFRGFRQVDQDNLFASLDYRAHLNELSEYLSESNAGVLFVESLFDAMPVYADSHVQADVRRSLGPLIRLIDDLDLILLAVRHDSKGAKTALSAGGGSVAFTALARTVLRVGRDPSDENRRVLAVGKSNNTTVSASLGFEIRDENGYPVVEWTGSSQHSADDIVADQSVGRGPRKLESAEKLLRELFGNRTEIEARDAKEKAKDMGISPATLDRAATNLGVAKQRHGFGPGGAVHWLLDGRAPHEHAHQRVAANGLAKNEANEEYADWNAGSLVDIAEE